MYLTLGIDGNVHSATPIQTPTGADMVTDCGTDWLRILEPTEPWTDKATCPACWPDRQE